MTTVTPAAPATQPPVTSTAWLGSMSGRPAKASAWAASCVRKARSASLIVTAPPSAAAESSAISTSIRLIITIRSAGGA